VKNKETILSISIISVIAFVIYWKKQRKNDNPRTFYVKKPFGNYNGYIVPPFGVFIKKEEKDNKDFHKHEMTHWKQWQQGGINFLFDWLNQQKEKGYDYNKYEIEARKQSGETTYCQTNYTFCVRNGKAKAYNKQFRT
jgi:hypothetical protein